VNSGTSGGGGHTGLLSMMLMLCLGIVRRRCSERPPVHIKMYSAHLPRPGDLGRHFLIATTVGRREAPRERCPCQPRRDARVRSDGRSSVIGPTCA
jgi:hypothetical protein